MSHGGTPSGAEEAPCLVFIGEGVGGIGMSGHGFSRVAAPHGGLGRALRASRRHDASATFSVQPEPADVVVARRAVVGAVRRWRVPLTAERFGDLELLAAEVITNAVRHSRAVCVVVVRWDGARVRVEVSDMHPGLPTPRRPSSDAEVGRGLVLVEALATRWGTGLRPGGKVVWFEIAAPHAGRQVRTAVTAVSGRLARTCRSVRRSRAVLRPVQRQGAVR
jgi:anti-sigma regulatory factor (Ser/Thr protein kinase)